MYLIKAEASGFGGGGLAILDGIRILRGMAVATATSDEEFLNVLMEERRSELNFEGHRYFDLAHFGKVNAILGEDVLPCLPVPQREVNASGSLLEQYPGY